jgi:hypothetical protein
MVLTEGGNVGIGTTSPDTVAKLHAYGSSGTKIKVQTTGGDGTTVGLEIRGGATNAQWSIETNKSTVGGAADNLYFYKNAGTTGVKMVITDGGFVGIGTTAPQSKLDVNGNIQISNATIPMGLMTEVGGTTPLLNFSVNFREPNKNNTYRGAAFRIDTRDTQPLFQWLTRSAGSTTENIQMVLTEGGNVGIGTTSPASKLDVNGAITARGNLEVKHTANPGIELRDTDGGTPYIDFSTDTVSDYNGRIIYSGGDFQTQGTKLLDLVESDIRTRWTNSTPWVWLRRTGTTIAADIGGRIIFESSYDTAGNVASLVYIDGRKENATSGDTASYLRIYTRPSGGSMTETLRIDSNGHVLPRRTAGTQNLGDATYYWNDVSYKTLTDRGCLGWFDDGVELQDGRIVSDVEAIKQIRPHPTKKTVYGKPMLDYRTLPKAVYKPAAINGVPLPRDENDEPYLITTEEVELTDNNGKPVLDKDGKPITVKKVVKRQAADGAELTSLISIMLGAIKELDAKIVALEQKNAELEKEIEMLRKQ